MAALKADWNRRGPTTTTGGSANAQTIAFTGRTVQSLVRGQTYSFIAGFSNTGATTLKVDSLTATAIRYQNAALTGGEIVAGQTYQVVYDGTAYQIVSPIGAISQYNGFKNILINGDLEIWQRGAGGTASIAASAGTSTYTADRWYLATAANQASVVSQQAGLTNGSRYCARAQRNSGQTGTGGMTFAQPLTTDQVVAIRGSIITISARVRSGANWSPTSGAVSIQFWYGTGAEGKRTAGFTGDTQAATSGNVNLGTSSAVTLITGTSAAVIPTNAAQAEIQIAWSPTGTAGAADYVEIDEVQLEIGGNVTTFDRRPFSVGLSECQRFYWKSFPYGTAPAQSGGVTGAITVKNPIALGDPSAYVQYPSRMRTTPTITTYNPSAANANWRDITAGSDATVSVDPSTTKGDSGVLIATSGTVATLGDILAIHLQADGDL